MADKNDSGAIVSVGLNTPFQEQIDFFRQKLNLPTEHWDDIQRSAFDRSFTVAGAMKADLLADFNGAIAKVIGEGESIGWFRKEFTKIVNDHGWTGWTGEGSRGGFNWRTRVIYQTNLSTSYAAGRYRQLTDPELLTLRPYWRYKHADGVANPRLQHVAWNGLTLPHDHPFWQTHFPPNGWGCHCRIVAVSAREYAKSQAAGEADPPEGWDAIDDKTGDPVGIAKGFGYAPGASVADELRGFVQSKSAALPLLLGQALAASVQPVLAAPAAESIGRFLDVKGAGVAQGALGVAVPAIDKVHDISGLPNIPVMNSSAGTFQGQYSYKLPSHDPIGIKVSSQSRNPALTALHEIGHFIDHQSINGQKGYASPFDPLLEKWRIAIDGSIATAELSGELVRTNIQRVRKTCGYYLSRHEQWARAYAQYIATRSADPVLLAQLDAIRTSAHAVYRASQWSDDDFAPIGAAIDELLTTLGLKR